MQRPFVNVRGSERKKKKKRNAIGSRLVIARNMVIQLGNCCVDIGWRWCWWWRWWKTKTCTCKAGNGYYNNRTDTCSPATFTDDLDFVQERATATSPDLDVRVSVQQNTPDLPTTPLTSFALCVRVLCCVCTFVRNKFCNFRKILQTLKSFTEILCLRFVCEHLHCWVLLLKQHREQNKRKRIQIDLNAEYGNESSLHEKLYSNKMYNFIGNYFMRQKHSTQRIRFFCRRKLFQAFFFSAMRDPEKSVRRVTTHEFPSFWFFFFLFVFHWTIMIIREQ